MTDKTGHPSIERLSCEIAACRLCRDSPNGRKPLPHELRPVAILSATARILIAGQAPGLRVHETGIPFRAIPDEMETVLLVAAATNARRAARVVAARIRPSRPTKQSASPGQPFGPDDFSP